MKQSFATRTKWKEKMLKPLEPRTVPVPEKWRKQYGSGTMVISTPQAMAAELRKVRKGHVVTMRTIRERLAERHGADHTCPLTAGIFWRICAEAAEVARREGASNVTPWWRVVNDDGSMRERAPGGAENQARLLREEGVSITITPKGKVVAELPGR